MSKNKIQLILDIRGSSKVRGEIGKIQGRLKGLKDSIFSIKTALVGLGAGLVAKSFLNAADTSEKFRTRLNILLGSVEEGNRLFKEMKDYASRVPFEFEEIMESATQLAGVMNGGVDEIKQWMPLIGDLAAASGLSIRETTEQFIRMYSAGAASADMFRERGILAMLGFKAGVSYTAEETRKKLIEAWEDPFSKFRGATDKLAKDWGGLTSMMSDKWFAFRNKVMNAAPFERLKASLKLLNDHLDENSGKIDEYAEQIGKGIIDIAEKVALGTAGLVDTFAPMVETLWDSLNSIWKSYRSFPPWVQQIGLVGAVVGGKKGAFVIAGLVQLLATAKNSVRGFEEVFSGKLSLKEFSGMNSRELAEYLEKLDASKGESQVDLDLPKAGSFKAKIQDLIDKIKGIADASRNAGEDIKKNLGEGGGSGVGEAITALKKLGIAAEETRKKVAAASGAESSGAPELERLGPGVLHVSGPTKSYAEYMADFRKQQEELLKSASMGKKSFEDLKAEAEAVEERIKNIKLGDISSEAAIAELNSLQSRAADIKEQLRVFAEPRLKLEGIMNDIKTIRQAISEISMSIPLNFQGTGSPTLPLSEYADYAKTKIAGIVSQPLEQAIQFDSSTLEVIQRIAALRAAASAGSDWLTGSNTLDAALYARRQSEKSAREASYLEKIFSGGGGAVGGQVNVTVGPIYTTAGRDDARKLQEDIADDIRNDRSPIISAVKFKLGMA